LSKYAESVRWYSSDQFYSTDARGFDWNYQNKRLIIGLDRLLSSNTTKDLEENQPYFKVIVEKLSDNNGQESVIGYDEFPEANSYASSMNKFVLDDSLDYSENGRYVDLRAIKVFNHLYNPREPHPSSELPVVEYQSSGDKQIWIQFEIDFAIDVDLNKLDLVVNVNALGRSIFKSTGDLQINISQSMASIKW